MTIPSLVLGLLLATLYGAAFHLWRGGGPARLLLYVVLSWIGFWGGHFLASTIPISLGGYGPLQIGLATLGSLLILSGGYWLSKVENIQV